MKSKAWPSRLMVSPNPAPELHSPNIELRHSEFSFPVCAMLEGLPWLSLHQTVVEWSQRVELVLSEVLEVRLLEKSAMKLLEENEIERGDSIYITYSACSMSIAWKDKAGRLKK